jgi:uncharacterized membrane protein HdeD (DUF308 family)
VFGEREGRAANIAIGLVDAIVGVVILAWPEISLSTLAVLVGIVLILRGALFIVAGWELRRLT